MSDSQRRLGFIGAGRAAGVLATGLLQAGHTVSAVASRSQASADALAKRLPGCVPYRDAQMVADACDLVFITTPDDAIETVARAVRWRAGTAVVHCSGAMSTDVLSAAKECGAAIGSLHPMQTFPAASTSAACLVGVAFAVEAEPPLREELKAMARSLGGWPVEIDPQDRALYHLSGFLACGAIVTLLGQASELWESMGHSRKLGLEVLLPILKSTVESLESQGIPGALTGPISRGDVGTVRKHLDALERGASTVLPTYCELALGAIQISRGKGSLDAATELELTTLVRERLNNVGRVPVG